MKVVALVSGGKDSCYAMMKCIQYGHEIVALANLMPADDSVDELDSFMYQTVGHQIIVGYAQCMGLPLFRRRIQGSTRLEKLNYQQTLGDEVEDMFILVSEVKKHIPSVQAVSSGAIASDYQRLRVESVCSRLGLVSLAYLWKQDQSLLLQEMITNGIVAIIVKVAALGLDPAKHLGKEIALLKPHLHKLKELYGINVCGEGGEYETLTLDCPLFVNARIVLDKFEIVLHSPESIAPVGVIHPVAFHLEKKEDSILSNGNDPTDDLCWEKKGSVFEVQGDTGQMSELACVSPAKNIDVVEVTHNGLHMSKTRNQSTFSICCWLQDPCKSSMGLHEDLNLVLKHMESQLAKSGLSWEHVLYIHLYIADMNEFSTANETYVRFITQEKCLHGVPSRSTVELPLLQAGLGRAYIEVLVSNDQSKNVLHVQSISSWAPSCIGPYSQATLHKEVLYMAGQLGLDPPTMTLCSGGPTVELEQALENCEAVAKSFKCSISTSAVVFTTFCSMNIPLPDRSKIHDKQESFVKQMRLHQEDERRNYCEFISPIYLYILVPDLPKRALVEVKPILFVSEDGEKNNVAIQNAAPIAAPHSWGFLHAYWHNSCIQKCVVDGKICAAVLSVAMELVSKICGVSFGSSETDGDHQNSLVKGNMERVSRFCIYLLNKVIIENGFSWEDTVTLKIYFQLSLGMTLEMLSVMFTNAFNELAEMGLRARTGAEPLFNLVPVLGAGRSATSIDDIITCELFAQKC